MKRKTAQRNNRRKPLISRSARRRLTAYLAAGVGAVAMGEGAPAAIVTTIDGSSTGLNGSVPIDFNQDGSPEFIIAHRTSFPSLTTQTDIDFDMLLVGAGTQGSNQGVLLSSKTAKTDAKFPAAFGSSASALGPAGSFAPLGGPLGTTKATKATKTGTNPATPGILHFSSGPVAVGNFRPGSGTQFLGLTWDFQNRRFFGWVQLTVNSPGTVDRFGFDDVGTPIPEPGTLLLLASGVAGLFALRKRKSKSAQA